MPRIEDPPDHDILVKRLHEPLLFSGTAQRVEDPLYREVLVERLYEPLLFLPDDAVGRRPALP